jgi:putative transposase
MPRPSRYLPGGMVFHVLNRAVGRRTLFSKEADYVAFERVLEETLRIRAMRICAYSVMPNHWHFVLWPERDGNLSAFFQQLTNTHVKRWKEHRREVGYGHLYQGRFKCFPVQTDDYFYDVVRYVERNPLRANLVARAEEWPWSSLGRSQHVGPERAETSAITPILSDWPLPRPSRWRAIVNRPQNESEVAALRQCVNRGCPYGDAHWASKIATSLGLESTLRSRGRPKQSA